MTYIVQPITSKDHNTKNDVERELRKVSREMGTLVDRLPTVITHEEPPATNQVGDPLFGYIAYADGTDWSPDASNQPGFYIKGKTGWKLLVADI